MQQPAAFRDAILVGRRRQNLASRYPQVLQQHDLVAAQITAYIKRLKAHLQS